MKKIISLVLVTMMVITATAATAFAAPGKKGPQHVPHGIAKKLFNDSDEVKWAQKAIEKLKIKGLVRGWEDSFMPKSSVTRIEAVVMALRVLGWEDEALSQTRLTSKYKGAAVQQWAVGYVNVAYEKGILDEVDMMYFKPQEPAKRHEVAKYVIRALGKDDEAKAHMDDDLPFRDAAAVPQGSVGYVYLANELGLMKGDGRNFNPMGTLTRAEMAVLFSNLDDRVEGDEDGNEYTGIIQDIEDDEIVLRINGVNKTFDVDEDAIIYDENSRIDYADLDEGDRVLVQLSGGKVVYIEKVDASAGAEKIIFKYEGQVSKVSVDPSNLTVKVLDMTVIFEVPSTAGIYFNGVKGSLSEIREGDKVTVTVDNRNKAIRINVGRQKAVESEVKGTIEQVGNESVKVVVNGSVKEYQYASDFTIDVKGRPDSLTSIEKGMNAELRLKDGRVASIYAEDNEFTVDGTIKLIEASNGKYRLTIKAGSKDYICDLSADAEIYINGAEKEIGYLDEGMEGEFEIINLTIFKVEIDD